MAGNVGALGGEGGSQFMPLFFCTSLAVCFRLYWSPLACRRIYGLVYRW